MPGLKPLGSDAIIVEVSKYKLRKLSLGVADEGASARASSVLRFGSKEVVFDLLIYLNRGFP